MFLEIIFIIKLAVLNEACFRNFVKMKLNGRSIKKQFVFKSTSRISQGAHATKITVLTNHIRDK